MSNKISLSRIMAYGAWLLPTAIVVYGLVVCFNKPLFEERFLPSCDRYRVYQDYSALSVCERAIADFLPSQSKDVWVACDNGFGYEEWQVSCIVLESDLRRFVSEQLKSSLSASDVFGMYADSCKSCNVFYQMRLGLSASELSSIRSRDRFLDCHFYDKSKHWHLTYCYDRISNVLACDFGR